MNAVLVVDDDKIQRLIISKILRSVGLRVIFATNGMEALEQVRQHSPSLVILDMLMPEMNGLQVCQKLKADAKTNHLPIVMYSGQEREFDSYWKNYSRADAYVSKVCRPQALIDTVMGLLNFSQACA
ncbi:MAG TPA: two-component system response regulator [Cyanobacteria bacterium UBA11149]|nr:two-component system response regulator [Cyanobacteria bacterium UBA11367]HBE60262.1 two-component system response regulator [Cyanobacteria bacterium UBA11366]HBK62224.1 two-component system response regulator [Cyanobacteria bacterium UBA11166]HBR74311.1 two-component system response regulator [Cyanobacteria bacterium UBA11159]HBS68527.1 two-component system response regulator [Cyanobacteria bacterium UBA11153]HBW90697.1 two-component system response regulator [Cyanobacteria bacterium UBA11